MRGVKNAAGSVQPRRTTLAYGTVPYPIIGLGRNTTVRIRVQYYLYVSDLPNVTISTVQFLYYNKYSTRTSAIRVATLVIADYALGSVEGDSPIS